MDRRKVKGIIEHSLIAVLCSHLKFCCKKVFKEHGSSYNYNTRNNRTQNFLYSI